MAKRGGFPGGMPGNMNNLMKQAQRMQRQMEETTKELEEKEYTAAAGGGAGPPMAGLETGVGPRLCLRPGGRVPDGRGKACVFPDRRGRNACLPLRPIGCCRAGRCPCAGGRRAGPGRGKDPVRHGAGVCAKAVCKPERSACGASSSAAPAGARLPG